MWHSTNELHVSICIALNSSRGKSYRDFYHIVPFCAYFSVSSALGAVTLFFLPLHSFYCSSPCVCCSIKKNKVKIASKKCRINHICFKEAISKDLYACSYFFCTWSLCFLVFLVNAFMYSLPVSLPFVAFFFSKVKKKWRVYVDWHAHSTYVGVLVCIDSVYKCCIKTSNCL